MSDLGNSDLQNSLQNTAVALRGKKVSCRELVDESLRAIERLDAKLNAFITVDADAARLVADERDRELARGVDRGPLHGIPIAHKDLIRTKGLRTTAGSKVLTDYIPKRDAEIVTQLHQAGAISVGKTGLHEFAYGITSNNPHFGAIHNPWDLERISGGSSGGSAAAVAAGIIPFATGTDTGGSIRIPASFCGVVGLKPTFGRVSCRGVLPLGITQDHVGPITRTVRDAAIAFNAMVANPSGAALPTSEYVPPPGVDLAGIRVGWPQNFFFDNVDEEVSAAVRRSFQSASGMKARIIEVQMPDMEAIRWAAVTCLLSEAAATLKPYLARSNQDGRDFGDDVRALIDQGLAVPAVDYLEALRVRRKMRREFNRLWTEVDCIFTPTTPIAAPLIGQTTIEVNGHADEVRSAATRLTRGMNALGLPAISIPCGLTRSGLPIGLQVIAGANQEAMILRVAAAMEDAVMLTNGRATALGK